MWLNALAGSGLSGDQREGVSLDEVLPGAVGLRVKTAWAVAPDGKLSECASKGLIVHLTMVDAILTKASPRGASRRG